MIVPKITAVVKCSIPESTTQSAFSIIYEVAFIENLIYTLSITAKEIFV